MKSERSVSELKKHVGFWLRFVSNHVSHAFMQKVEARGVTVAEWAVMREMLEAGPANPSQLAERLGMTRGAISKLVERFVRQSTCRTNSLRRGSPLPERGSHRKWRKAGPYVGPVG